MDTEERESRREDENRSTDLGENNRIWSSCCGAKTAGADQMMRSCPCITMLRGSEGSFAIGFAVAGLLFSIIVTGWVLGVLAFLRTI